MLVAVFFVQQLLFELLHGFEPCEGLVVRDIGLPPSQILPVRKKLWASRVRRKLSLPLKNLCVSPLKATANFVPSPFRSFL